MLATAATVQTAYHSYFRGWNGLSLPNVQLCLFVSALFVVSNAMRNEYSITNYFDLRGHGGRSFPLWNVVFLSATTVGFLTKSIEESSRAGFILFYLAGFLALYLERAAVVRFVRASASAGGVSARRVFLAGFEHDIETFTQRSGRWASGMDVVGAVVLRDAATTLEDDLVLAAASARMLRPDDVFILAPWSRTDVIDACVTAFLPVPAQIHLGPERVLDRFVDAHIDKIGSISSLSLSGRPLNFAEVTLKRAFDIVASSLGLIVLSPLLIVVAILIKLDSPGPVFFLQRRYGFNREPFRIVKYRSMSTMEEGRAVKQVTANDSRVTRVGRFIRRFNIDELPQLFNVLRGEMSLVGPRPHPLVLDQLFERKIALYARRHNVKPGITGWAQVNGLRGETNSPEKIRGRVEHDLYYIDNWSFPFDLWIVILTVFSRKAYRNAV